MQSEQSDSRSTHFHATLSSHSLNPAGVQDVSNPGSLVSNSLSVLEDKESELELVEEHAVRSAKQTNIIASSFFTAIKYLG